MKNMSKNVFAFIALLFALLVGLWAGGGCVQPPAAVGSLSENESTLEPAPTNDGKGMLLPDLVPFPPTDIYIMNNRSSGIRELYFDTTVMNIGEGPLELVGFYDEESGMTRAVQRIKTDNGQWLERVAGYFIFHEGHDHWHFEDFVELEVLPLDSDGQPGEVLASTGKMTFCLHDISHLDNPPPGSPQFPAYPGCDPVIQGLSVGWVDNYIPQLPGQQLNIGSLPDGFYMLRLTVNPANLILEKDTDNNPSVTYVVIRGSEVSLLNSPE